VLDWCQRASKIGLSAIAVPELISAFCRLEQENKINREQYQQLKSLLFSDIEDIAMGELTAIVLFHSINSLENSKLRAMDSIHIGSAIALKCDTFISTDSLKRRNVLDCTLKRYD
jgi:uncharacterized protein